MCNTAWNFILLLAFCLVASSSESFNLSPGGIHPLARIKRQTNGRTEPPTMKFSGPPEDVSPNSSQSLQTLPSSASGCVLPPFPSNGKWVLASTHVPLDRNRRYLPGQIVPKSTALQYKCKKQHARYPNTPTIYICNDGWGLPQPPPECLKTCSPITTTARMTVMCTRNNVTIDCDSPYDGTQVHVQCTSLYEESEVWIEPLGFCDLGLWKWNSPLPKCEARINVSTGGCVLPTFQSNGKWEVFVIGKGMSYQPGQSVAKGTILQYKCNTQHALYPNTPVAYCNDGWSIPQPECLKTCSPINNTDRMTAKCTLNDLAINCQTPYEGTQAEVECTSLYEAGEFFKRRLRFCQDGSWKPPLPECEPICGLKSTEAQSQVIGGVNTKHGEYPWMVGIYLVHNKQHVCGGSIITPGITLTAAHCFEHSQDPNYYMLAAGKYYREYSEPKDKDAVFSKIKVLKIHDQFRNGENMFAYDIAIMVVETPFKPSRFIMPVCIDYDTRFDEASLVNTKGLVTGWGFTTSVDSPSDVLKVLEVSYLSESTCPLPEDLRRFYQLARDKMCAGSTNKGESTCQGDSGGPLIFKRNQRYFIRGIVSLGAKDKTTYGCDSNHVTLFTGVHHHVQLIQQYVTRYRDTD